MTDQYESIHQTPNGPGDGRPTALQIIENEQLHGQWAGKTVLITGCSSGLGVETAKAILQTGAMLYLTARDLNKARSALGPIAKNDKVHLLELNLDSLASVRKCADTFLAMSRHLNVLIANAGVMASPEIRTEDGFESQFATNHLAHFLLIQLLLPSLVESSSTEFQSRVVILSSSAHRMGGVNFSNLNLEGEYHPWVAYAQSKTANLYTANELERRYGRAGVHAWSVQPGLIFTGLMQHMEGETLQQWNEDPTVVAVTKSTEQGAATSVWAATGKALESKGGRYLEDCQIAKPAQQDAPQSVPGYAAHAYDGDKERLLWEKSLELVQPFLK